MHRVVVKEGKWGNVVNEVLAHEVCEDPECEKSKTTMFYPYRNRNMFCTICNGKLNGGWLFCFPAVRRDYYLNNYIRDKRAK